MTTVQSSPMVARMIRAAKLEPGVFEEAEHSPALQTEAITVVALVAGLNAVGAFLSGVLAGEIGGAFIGLIIGFILAMIGFFIWAGLTYLIGTRVFGGTADYGELIRAMGYAYTPNILGVLIFIPLLGGLLSFIGSIWALVASVIAIRQALDFDTVKAVLTVVVGWVVIFILTALIATLGFVGAGTLG